MESAHGAAWEPTLTVTSDASTFRALAAGELALDEAARSGRIAIAGDRSALRRFAKVFVRPAPAELPAVCTTGM
jgi:hypothetical protein